MDMILGTRAMYRLLSMPKQFEPSEVRAAIAVCLKQRAFLVKGLIELAGTKTALLVAPRRAVEVRMESNGSIYFDV